MDYPMIIRKLSAGDGGGYLATFPDLDGCVSDGDTPEEAAKNAQDALVEWLKTNRRLGRDVPEPESSFERPAMSR